MCTKQNMRPGSGGYHANRKHLHVNNGDASLCPVTTSSLFGNRSISSINRIKQNERWPYLLLDKKKKKKASSESKYRGFALGY